MAGHVVGRLFWDDQHPSPWMSFPSKVTFEEWRADIRRARPGTKTEWHYCDSVWTANTMLRSVQQDARGATEEKETTMRVIVSTSRKARLAAQIQALSEEYAALAALPDEPEVETARGEQECNVIWFVKRFVDGGREYTYAAAKAGDGLWYTTGPQSPKGYSWEQLIEWIRAEDPETEVWRAIEWDLL